MLKLLKIGVTGGIAAGKSTVCFLFKAHGAYTVDADSIVHELLNSNPSLGKLVIELLGKDILTNNRIDRLKVANKVFDNPEKLFLYERLIHPYVFKEMQELYQTVEEQGKHRLFIVEIPLLFETRVENEFDFIITVTANDEECIKRLERKGLSRESYEKRKKRFLSLEQKIPLSDFVITNNGSLEDLREQVNQIIKKIVQKPHN
jgi:dephospho-CoA kinase